MRRFLQGFITAAVLLPAGAILSASMGVWAVEATAQPPGWEGRIARMIVRASVARRAPPVVNPVDVTSEQLTAGMKIYRSGCASCHGGSRKPSTWGTTSFYPRVPQFPLEPPQLPDWQMHWIVKHGVRYSGMAAWDRELSDTEIWQVVTFLSHLRSLPPDVAAAWTGK